MFGRKAGTGLLGIGLFILIGLLLGVLPSTPVAGAPKSTVFAEANDFSTLVLRDPWDMSEFTDVSQYLNQGGNVAYLDNIQVQNGIFSATATGLKDAQFFPLWTGYNTAMLLGKVGARYPINASTYHCLHVAAKVDAVVIQGNPDQMTIYWFANEKLNDEGSGGIWGHTLPGITLYPEIFTGGTGTPGWRLYSLDLSHASYFKTPWSGQAQWRGLRIDPTNQAVNFQIDWVRLTDCKSLYLSLSDLPTQTGLKFYIGTGGREILFNNVNMSTVQNNPYEFQTTTGSFDLDLQGVAPGTYTYTVRRSMDGTTVQTGSLTINQTPTVTFVRPSFFSGEDYGTLAGNPWDFADASDTPQFINVKSYAFQDGVLQITTASVAPDSADPIIRLNSPQPANTGEYRYLSFRMNTLEPLQNVWLGMIARWVWSIQGSSGNPGWECNLVSQDIPYDVGWQIVSLDLYDPFNGLMEERQGDCSGLPTHWTNTTPVLRMRFDPNENVLGHDLVQQLDWVKLTKVDGVTRGTPFPIQIGLNRPLSEVTLTFYYTTNPNVPTQNQVQIHVPSSAGFGQFRLYLPLVFRNYALAQDTLPQSDASFFWDTSGVTPGTYFICVQASDGLNAATYCSEAPIQVK